MHELTIVPPWLAPDLASLTAMGDKTSHALLLYGQSGIGKRRLGRALARALLCESIDIARREFGGCGECPGCLWFDQGSHPDFRRLVPEAVAVAEGFDNADDAVDDGSDEAADAEPAAPRSKKKASKEIKVDQVRALQAFLSIATHRSRYRVVLMYPPETLNDVAANALLKMLEEPPSRTVFILVSDHLGRLPATIVSRCHKVFVATPETSVAAAWLATREVVDPAALLALSGGAPYTALAFGEDEAELAAHAELVAFLQHPAIDTAMATAESFGKSAAAPLIRWIQQWVADCIGMRLAGRIRYHPTQSKRIAGLAGAARIDALMALMQRLDAMRRTMDHPLNTRLLLEGLLIAYAEALPPAADRRPS
ncbi:MAG: DNA polymerase III subunit delta' [Burkholderiaceae bacterium]